MPGQSVRYWRAEGGYQTVPTPPPAPPPPPHPFPQPVVMYFMQGYPGQQPQWVCYPGAHHPPPYSPYAPYPQHGLPRYQVCLPQQHQRFVPGPIPIAKICSPPPAYGKLSPPPPPPPSLPVPEKKGDQGGKVDDEAKKASKDGKAEVEKAEKDKKKENVVAAPKLPKQANYLFDKEHTMVHIFNKAAPVWTAKYREEKLKFRMFKVSVRFSVRMVIENVLRTVDEDTCKAWAVTEVIEKGSGGWDKGSTVVYDSEKSKGYLKNMGWSKKRGDVLPPVWLVVHKVDFK